MLNNPRLSKKNSRCDAGLQKGEDLNLGGIVTRSRLKKLQEDINMKMISLVEKDDRGDLKIINLVLLINEYLACCQLRVFLFGSFLEPFDSYQRIPLHVANLP